MPTTAFNRKYVVLSPQRAQRAWECIQLVITAQQNTRAAVLSSGTQDFKQIEQAELIKKDLDLLHDICARLNEQATRSGKVKAPNLGKMVVPPSADDYSDEKVDWSKLVLTEPNAKQ